MAARLWDTLVVNARIRGMEREGEIYAGMAIRGGSIDAMFADPPPPTLVHEAREVIDCGGRCVLPGLIDCHMHFLAASAFREAAVCAWDLTPPIAGMTLAEVGRKVKAYAAGMQVSCHAIGTPAIETLLTAYERVLDGSEGNPLRHRVEHFEFPTPDQARRATARGLALVAQPGFAWLDERYIHAYRRQLSPAQFARQIPLRDLLDAGAVVAGSSDYPAGLLSPWVQMQGVEARHALLGEEGGFHCHGK